MLSTGRNEPPPRRRRAGYTLIEVILAVSLLAVGLVGVLAAYAKSADTLRLAQDNLRAFTLLRREMAAVEVRACEQRYLPLGTQEGEFSEPDERDFRWRLEVTPSPVKAVNQVTLTVAHRRSGRSYTLATYLPGEPETPVGVP